MSGRYDLSSAEFDRERVARAANLTLQSIFAGWTRMREAAITEAMRERRFLWIKLPIRTREEAEAMIAGWESLRSPIERLSLCPWFVNGWGHLEIADGLGKLAGAAETATVRVSREDFAVISAQWANALAPAQDPHP